MKSRYYYSAAAIAFILLSAFAFAFKSPVKHIVVFKYKPAATAEQITQVSAAFKSLKDKIPGIISFESGVNNSPENLNKGFTHVYLVTFESSEARNTYLTHPEHKKFTDMLGKLGILDEPFVVDFEVGS